MTITVFPTCIVELTRPRLARRMADWLTGRGWTARAMTNAGCCGQPAWNAGYTVDARRVARRSLRALAATSGPIVVPSGSCATMMGRHWPELFAGDRAETEAVAVSGRVQELSACLATVLPAASTGTEPVAYHHSCHMRRELGIVEEPLAVLSACGLRTADVDGADQCCGFGGTFAAKFPELSTAMADARLDAMVKTGAADVVSADLSCLLHLEGRARRRGLPLSFRHLAEVVLERHDR